MDKRILYPSPERPGGVCLIIPAPGCPLTVEEIARKDTPAGLPYIIVDAADLPEEPGFFNSWEADFSNPDGVGIGHEAWFAEQAASSGGAP